jgi:hypothetical protein
MRQPEVPVLVLVPPRNRRAAPRHHCEARWEPSGMSFATLSAVVSHGLHLASEVETMGVTSVARFKWTR